MSKTAPKRVKQEETAAMFGKALVAFVERQWETHDPANVIGGNTTYEIVEHMCR